MSLSTQAKLLRVLETRKVERLGATGSLDVDVRILSATNKDLPAEISRQNFREDLYFRLRVVLLRLPPLREHREDIPLLVQEFCRMLGVKHRRTGLAVSREATERLMAPQWRGNVRELKNALESASVIVSIVAAYVVQQFQGIMDYVQALFSIFVAPLLATILFGMFWKRATRLAGFLGLLTGILFSASLFLWVKLDPSALAIVALSPDAKPMAENVFRALWAFLFSAIVILLVSMFTKPRPVAELDGLVYGATKLPTEEPAPWYKREWMWATVAAVIFAALNIIFW